MLDSVMPQEHNGEDMLEAPGLQVEARPKSKHHKKEKHKHGKKHKEGKRHKDRSHRHRPDIAAPAEPMLELAVPTEHPPEQPAEKVRRFLLFATGWQQLRAQ